MKVHELITALQQLPGGLEIYKGDDHGIGGIPATSKPDIIYLETNGEYAHCEECGDMFDCSYHPMPDPLPEWVVKVVRI